MKRYFAVAIGRIAVILLFTALAPIVASAHLEDNFDSVHFNSGAPSFGDLPRRAPLWDEQNVRNVRQTMSSQRDDERKQELIPQRQEARAERRDRALRKRARMAEERGDWAAARQIYAALAEVNGWSGDLRDRVDLLTAVLAQRPTIGRKGSTAQAVRDYLDGRYGPIAAGRDEGAGAKFLRPYARYQMAAATEDHASAIPQYQSLLGDYPHFARREAALIMLARAAILPDPPMYGWNFGAEPLNKGVGLDAIHKLLCEYPSTRFRGSALGLRARVDLAEGRSNEALANYLAIGDVSSIEYMLPSVPQRVRDAVFPDLLAIYLRQLDGAATYTRYMYAHETYARTLNLCESIAQEFPNTPTAPHALYRAACCYSKLANFNDWWRGEDFQRGLYRKAARRMKLLKHRYPHSPLVREAAKFAVVFEDSAEQVDRAGKDTPDYNVDPRRYRNEGL